MKNFQIGQAAALRRTFTANDLAEYASLAGIAANEVSSIPGPLLSGMFSCLMGTELPGRGTNWLKQKLAFPAPAHVGEEITATVEIVRVRSDKELVNLRTMCINARGESVCEGEALVLVKDVA
ncbi:MAG: phosphate acetyltransferase [Chloroflexi bacterium]|nr:phosphate acetyltransferase [Chloroflexota bacterium]